jgi:hypothetical protein
VSTSLGLTQYGTRTLELRPVLSVIVSDSGVSIENAKSELSFSDASAFFKELHRHNPGVYDLFIVVAAKMDTQKFIASLVKENVNWKINVIISRKVIVGSVFPGISRSLSDVVDYFAKYSEWPPNDFFNDYDSTMPEKEQFKKDP